MSILKNIARRLAASFADYAGVTQADALKFTKASLIDINRSLRFGQSSYPNPDPVLGEFSGTEGVAFWERIFREMTAVSGPMKMRVDAAYALPHTWMAGDPDDPVSVRVRDECAITHRKMDGVDSGVRELMLCTVPGYKVGEYTYGWREVQRKIAATVNETNEVVGELTESSFLLVPVRLVPRPTVQFDFDEDGNLYFTPAGSLSRDRRKLDPLQYCVARYGSSDWYGRAELQDIYNDVWVLDNINKMGLEAMEKQGYPLLVIKVPEVWTIERVNAFRYAALKTYPNLIVVQQGDRIEIEEKVGGTPTFIGSDQIARIQQLEDSISRSLLGVVFTGGRGVGSFAKEKVAESKSFEKTAIDGAIYDQIANDFRDKFIALNYPSLPERLWPFMVTDTKPQEDLDSWTDNVVKLVDRGMRADQNQAAEKLGITIALDDANALKAQKQDSAEVVNFPAQGADTEQQPTESSDQTGEVDATGKVKAGVVTEQTLNGAQITAAVEVITQMRNGVIGETAGIELLVAVGIPRDRAIQMVTETLAAPPLQQNTPAPVPPPAGDDDGSVTVMSDDGAVHHVASFEELRRITRGRK